MTETIASLVGAIIGAIITTSFWFVQHRIEQKDDLNNERRQDKRELVKNILQVAAARKSEAYVEIHALVS